MKLNRVSIKNFRSIKEITLDLDPRCRVLVGINESGKSNILKALSYLSNDPSPSKSDIRYGRDNEPPITESFVQFIFSLDSESISAISSAMQARTYSTSKDFTILRNIGAENPITIEDFVRGQKEFFLKVDFKNEQRSYGYWSASKDYELVSQWRKPTGRWPAEFVHSLPDGTQLKAADFDLLRLESYNGIPPKYLAEVTVKDFMSLATKHMQAIVIPKIPTCLYWTYNDKNLLPVQINMTSFAENPETCLPLKNMFELAGLPNIGAELADAKSQPIHVLRNLLNRVASTTTNHVREIWKEYEDIKIELSPNGDNIDATVSERSKIPEAITTGFDFSRRSDGFKRFVTFLLMVSTLVKTNSLSNSLLLIDEPEIGLHPSGAKHLMQELIRIAQKNYVVFSTHSISMIDKEQINRHMIVEKKEEITSVLEAKHSNVVDEEVLFRAIGYSIFDTLKRSNIVFEGWRDKRLCQLALNELLAEDATLQALFAEVGMCHADGVKDVRNITAFLEMAARKALVVSDADAPAKEKQTQYVKNHGYGLWKTYKELVPMAQVVTGEDFIKPAAFRPHLEKIRADHAGLPELTDANLCSQNGKLAAIDNWLRNGGINQPAERKAIINSVKEKVFEDLRAEQIEDSYLDIIRALTSPENWPNA